MPATMPATAARTTTIDDLRDATDLLRSLLRDHRPGSTDWRDAVAHVAGQVRHGLDAIGFPTVRYPDGDLDTLDSLEDSDLVQPALHPDDVIELGPGVLVPGDDVPYPCPAAA